MINEKGEIKQMGKMLTNFNNLNDDKVAKAYRASMKQLYWILGVATLLYYVIPYILLLFQNRNPAVYGYLIVDFFTLFAFISCFMHSKNHGVVWYVPIMIGTFFLPTVMIFNYDFRYAIFSIVYIVIGFFGCFTGYLFLRRKKKKKAPIGLNFAMRRSNKKYNQKGK